MPTYPVKNKETGETQELSMCMTAYDQWRKANPTGIKIGHKDALESERLVSSKIS